MRIEVLDDAEAVAERAAAILVEARGHVALSGGSTPKRAYALAAGRRPDWTGVTLWLGDERYVPPEDADANVRMISVALLTRVPQETRPALELVDTARDLEGSPGNYEARLRAAI